MFNPAVQLQYQPVGYSWARLQSLGRNTLTYDFLLNPEEISWSHSAGLSDVPVLYTAQPQTVYNNSSTTLSIPKVLIYTPGNSGSIRSILKQLETMTKPQGESLPVLALTWGNVSEPQLYMKNLNYRVIQYRSGDPTQATASMDFVRVAAAPVVTKSDALPQLSDREQKEYKTSIAKLLKDDKTVAARLGISSSDIISISKDGVVSTQAKSLGKVADVFPSLAKKSHSSIK